MTCRLVTRKSVKVDQSYHNQVKLATLLYFLNHHIAFSVLKRFEKCVSQAVFEDLSLYICILNPFKSHLISRPVVNFLFFFDF